MLARELVEQADDLVFHPAQALRAAAAVLVVEQDPLGLGAAFLQHDLEALRHRGAQLGLAAGAGAGQGVELGRDGGGVDQFAELGGRFGRERGRVVESERGHGATGIAECGEGVTGPRRRYPSSPKAA